MTWQGIEEHDEVVDKFRRALARNRLATTFLFIGPSGVGKRRFALKLAQALLCPNAPDQILEPCGRCASCTQLQAGAHPDLILVSKPADKSSIPVAMFIGDKEHRMQEGLCHAISRKPFMSERKIAIIDDADFLNVEGANALLKTLEEPPPRSVMILIGTSTDKQLPTIRSRSQIIRFRPLSKELIARLLVENQVIEDPATALRIATVSQGSYDRAVELADPELWTFRRDLLAQLSNPRFKSVALAQEVVKFVEAAGKDAAPRRARCRVLLTFVVDYFRSIMRAQAEVAISDDVELARFAAEASQFWGVEETAADALQRTLDALAHVDRNAHQVTLLEAWLDDLAVIRTGKRPASVGL